MTDALTPDSLKVGDLVGPWRVEGYAGRGTYGAVYRARRAGHPGSVPVALKLALFAYDPRFLREVALLSRNRHPGVPELIDCGWCVPAEPEPPSRRMNLGLGFMVATLLLVVAGALIPGSSGVRIESPEVAQVAEEKPDAGAAPDAGTSGLGETVATSRVATDHLVMMASQPIAMEVPKDPLPGQLRAPCRRRGAVEINGGCWAPWAMLTPPCGEEAYEWKSECYLPLYEKTRKPTSDNPQ